MNKINYLYLFSTALAFKIKILPPHPHNAITFKILLHIKSEGKVIKIGIKNFSIKISINLCIDNFSPYLSYLLSLVLIYLMSVAASDRNKNLSNANTGTGSVGLTEGTSHSSLEPDQDNNLLYNFPYGSIKFKKKD